MDLLSYLNKNLQMLVILEGGTPKNPEKNPRRDSRTNKKLNPHIALGQKPTGTTLVGGERSPHWGIRPQRLIPWLTPSVNSPRLPPTTPHAVTPWLTRTGYEKNKRSKLGRRPGPELLHTCSGLNISKGSSYTLFLFLPRSAAYPF